METIKEKYYLGIDLNENHAMISYYQSNMKEPETVSTIAGSQIFQIPLVLARKKMVNQWYFGEDAKKLAKQGEMIFIDNLLVRAKRGEIIQIDGVSYEGEELLALFMKKLIALPQTLGNQEVIDRVVLTVEQLDRDMMEMYWRIMSKAGIKKEQFMIMDHKESFYYFAYHQPEELWAHDICLFEYQNGNLFSYTMSRNVKTTPQLITIIESGKMVLAERKDQIFADVLENTFENHIVTTVYLVGDGFEGNWMKLSLPVLCRGRRAFMGNNLFSKGACYAAAVCDSDNWQFVYIGENEMKYNLSLKTYNQGTMEFFTLISAGKNWFESEGECEVIISGSMEIDFWKQLPNSREAKIETLQLTDIPKRPDKTTRVRITAKPLSDQKIEITMKDLGFGELFRSSDKTWKYIMTM